MTEGRYQLVAEALEARFLLSVSVCHGAAPLGRAHGGCAVRELVVRDRAGPGPGGPGTARPNSARDHGDYAEMQPEGGHGERAHRAESAAIADVAVSDVIVGDATAAPHGASPVFLPRGGTSDPASVEVSAARQFLNADADESVGVRRSLVVATPGAAIFASRMAVPFAFAADASGAEVMGVEGPRVDVAGLGGGEVTFATGAVAIAGDVLALLPSSTDLLPRVAAPMAGLSLRSPLSMSMFMDGLTAFTRESAALGAPLAAGKSHVFAWTVTLAMAGLDAVLVGRWMRARRGTRAGLSVISSSDSRD